MTHPVGVEVTIDVKKIVIKITVPAQYEIKENSGIISMAGTIACDIVLRPYDDGG
jgi:hypothetical protein